MADFISIGKYLINLDNVTFISFSERYDTVDVYLVGEGILQFNKEDIIEALRNVPIRNANNMIRVRS